MPDYPMNATRDHPSDPIPHQMPDVVTDHPMNETEWCALIDRIEDHEVVPALGRALSRVTGPDGLPTKLYDDLLLQNIKALSPDQRNVPITSYEELFVARQTLGEADIDFHKGLARQIGRYKTISKPFEDLAAISGFRLFLSTAPDNALSEVLKQDSSRNAVDTRTFDGTALVDLPRNFSTTPRTCVFKLLGGVETAPNWALFGDDLVRMLFALYDTRTKPTELLRYLDDKHILAIGCQVPDWFGRFFVHWMRSGPLRKSRASQHLIDADSDIDALFRKYICQFGKKAIVISSNPVEFVAELRRRWDDRQKSSNRPATSPTPNIDVRPSPSETLDGKVFISYVGSDRPHAEKIADHLTNKSVDVFYDKESIPPGTHWESFLGKALDKCMAFLVLISEEAMQRDESVAFYEWRRIVERSDKMRNKNEFVYPILIDDGRIERVPADFNLDQFQALTLKETTDLDELAASLCRRQRALRRNAH